MAGAGRRDVMVLGRSVAACMERAVNGTAFGAGGRVSPFDTCLGSLPV